MEKIRVFCSMCKHETNHEIVKSINNRMDYEDIVFLSAHQIVRCRWCWAISYRTVEENTEDSYYDEDNQQFLNSDISIYPERWEDFINKKYFGDKTPTNIESLYSETVEAFNKNLFILCAWWVRWIIEAVSIAEGIKWWYIPDTKGNQIFKKDLFGKIEWMHQKQIISKRYKDFFHKLRGLWNNALHDTEVPSNKELKIAIDIIEKTIFNLYGIGLELENFEDHENRRKIKLKNKKKI